MKKIFIIILIMGLCIYDIALVFSLEKMYPDEIEIECICEIIENKESKEYYDKYIIKIIKSNIRYSPNTKLILYLKKDKEFFVGDILKLKGKFEKGEIARNYKGFNYRNYLKQSKIYGIVTAEETNYISNKKDIYFMIGSLKSNLEKQIDKLYKDDYSEFLKGILIGNKSGLDEKIIKSFQTANISHILAISGLHISFILFLVNYLLKKLINNKKINNLIVICFLIFFLVLTGSSISCMRACIMNIFMILSSIFNRKNNFYRNFFISFLIIIILNPYNIFSVGLWLSYLGTIGIVLVFDLLYKILNIKLKLKSKILRFILKSFTLSLSAQIFIFPIMIYFFNSFSLSFFISNIIISFLIGPILAIGYISIFTIYPITAILSWIENIMIYIVFQTASLVSKIPFSNIFVITPNLIFIILYYLLMAIFIIYLKNNKFLILRFFINPIEIILKNKNKILNKLLCTILIFTIIFNINKLDCSLKIYFVDVGQGDCTIIKTPNRKTIIIDSGEGNSEKYDYGENVVFPYLLDRGINKIDYLIVSHCDSDHIGGLIYILQNMKVGKILIGLQPKTSNQLEDLIKISKQKRIEILTLQKEDKIKLENNIEIEVLWPDKNNLISDNALNNNSLVFKLKYNNFSILFTGDIEKVAEEKIISLNKEKLNSTIIKAPHHGSKSSSTAEFIQNVNPAIVLIGVGKNNKFGHPSEEVLKRYENSNIKIYRTDLNGEIFIKVNKNGKIIATKFVKK